MRIGRDAHPSKAFADLNDLLTSFRSELRSHAFVLMPVTAAADGIAPVLPPAG
jgi:hypothetical protein